MCIRDSLRSCTSRSPTMIETHSDRKKIGSLRDSMNAYLSVIVTASVIIAVVVVICVALLNENIAQVHHGERILTR
eukprot:3792981-Rhodomonas_salina.3